MGKTVFRSPSSWEGGSCSICSDLKVSVFSEGNSFGMWLWKGQCHLITTCGPDDPAGLGETLIAAPGKTCLWLPGR